MSDWFWSGTIGGVELLDGTEVAGFELEGAGAFEQGDYTGNTRPGLLGNPQSQYEEIIGSRVITIKFIHCPKTLLTSLKNLLLPLIPSGSSVACTFTDSYFTINRNFKPLPGDWLSRGLPDGDYINDVIIKLIETGA